MRKLCIPDIDSYDLYDKIVDSTRSHDNVILLKEIESDIKLAYREYSEAESDFHNLSAILLEPPQKKAIKNAYKRNSRKIRENILMELDIEARAECPACRIGEPHTLDHVLPKEDYPEFSIFISNLIPVCGRCNSKKSLQIKDELGIRKFLHNYFDDITEFSILKCQITLKNNLPIPKFTVEQPSSMENDELFRIVKNHFESLGLADRYLAKAAEELNKDWEKHILNGTIESIEEKLKECQKHKGINHWEAAYYQGLNDFKRDEMD